MAISKEEILETVGNMTVMDLNDLVKAFEEKFGVSAAAAPAPEGAAYEDADAYPDPPSPAEATPLVEAGQPAPSLCKFPKYSPRPKKR